MKQFLNLLLILLLPSLSFAQTTDSLYMQICDFRMMFCGDTAIAVVAVLIFGFGILIFTGKVGAGGFNWTVVIAGLVGAIIFVAAEQIAAIISDPPPGFEASGACQCN